MAKSSKIRRSAQGQECQIRIPGVCNGNPETTVLCHLPGGGMGGKMSDIHAAYGCSECHDYVDGRKNNKEFRYSGKVLKVYFYEGVFRTQEILLRDGLIKI